MRITVIRHSIRHRGGDRATTDYINHLAARGHQITYWTNLIQTAYSFHPNVQMCHIPWKGKLGTIIFALSSRFMSDIVFVDLVVMAGLTSFRNRGRVIMLAQDYDVSYYSSALLRWFVECIYWFTFRIMKVPVIVESDSLYRKLEKFHPPQHRIANCGIDLDHYRFNPQSKYRVHKSKPFVILLAVWKDYRKGIDIGLQALKHLKTLRGQDDWELWTIGEKIDPLPGVAVRNFGFVKNEDLKDILSAADIYLMPSRSEGLSLLFLSALACRCIVVGSEAVNILTHRMDGMISPVEDWKGLASNLNAVMEDGVLRETIKKNAKVLIQHYGLNETRPKFEEALLDLYQSNLRSS